MIDPGLLTNLIDEGADLVREAMDIERLNNAGEFPSETQSAELWEKLARRADRINEVIERGK